MRIGNLCFQKISVLSQQRGLEIPGGWGGIGDRGGGPQTSRAKTFTGRYEAKLEFSEGRVHGITQQLNSTVSTNRYSNF